MEIDGSLPHSQQPATYPYSESGDSLLEYIIEENITRQQQQQLPFTVVKIKSCIDGLYFLLSYILCKYCDFHFCFPEWEFISYFINIIQRV